ncbi:hypothetical protein E2C01_004090 [Portunus trituberculatus]|uniref:Uncharacterized protein n=1 Tax=Portunus trituberculatus TaxID=210409 RepID=A0A5B7CRY1_PORTR|nr:hypothetical protein [Portunus trituberculatus]
MRTNSAYTTNVTSTTTSTTTTTTIVNQHWMIGKARQAKDGNRHSSRLTNHASIGRGEVSVLTRRKRDSGLPLGMTAAERGRTRTAVVTRGSAA